MDDLKDTFQKEEDARRQEIEMRHGKNLEEFKLHMAIRQKQVTSQFPRYAWRALLYIVY